MKWLETRIPPPVLLFACFLLAKSLASKPLWLFYFPFQAPLAIAVAGLAILLALTAVVQMFRHKTTVNPMSPDNASALLTSGVFAISRNPIYLADVMLLLAYVLHLGALSSLVAIPVFVVLLQYLQILPEERALTLRFSSAYSDYLAKVRRWI